MLRPWVEKARLLVVLLSACMAGVVGQGSERSFLPAGADLRAGQFCSAHDYFR
jgi:hypothetical protein